MNQHISQSSRSRRVPCQPWCEGRAFAVKVKVTDTGKSWPARPIKMVAMGLFGAIAADATFRPRDLQTLAAEHWPEASE